MSKKSLQNYRIMENNYHVLLVEDNIFNQKVASAMVKKLGLTIDIANNGMIALEKMLTNNYNIVLMDCHMPIMNGYDTTVKIRTSEKENGKHIPIIAMTAHDSQEDREYCFEIGIDGYISKPFRIDDLRKELSHWKLI
ncbi:response regulator [Candidatus Halobeggiatoa sp. HSG11]|nr:response regulator [Candidatus Halobeggiatoa sp. HSG11]